MKQSTVGFLMCLAICRQVTGLQPNRLLVISFEGLESGDFKEELVPNMARLKKSGLHATNVKNVFPHQVLPNHITIATGVSPQDHGNLGSTAYDPHSNTVITASQQKFWDQINDIPRIWELNEKARQAHYSGVMKWPGVNHRRVPTFAVSYDQFDGKNKFIDLSHDFDTVLSWFTDRKTPANLVMFHVAFPKTEKVSIGGDGNCLFRALSYGLYHSEEQHMEVRKMIVDYVVDHWSDEFRSFHDYHLVHSETRDLLLKLKFEEEKQRKSNYATFINLISQSKSRKEISKEQCGAEEDKCGNYEYLQIEESTGDWQNVLHPEDNKPVPPTLDYREIHSGLYGRWMGSNGVWGTMFEIAIFAKVFERAITVLEFNQECGKYYHILTFDIHKTVSSASMVNEPIITLLWSEGNQNGHFDVLLHPVESGTSPSCAKLMKEHHLAKVDRLIENLMSGLKDHGLLQNMSIVLLSDHNTRIVHSEDIVYLRDKVPEDQCLLLGKSPVLYAIPKPDYHSTTVLMKLMQIDGFGDKFKVFTKDQIPIEWNLKNSSQSPSFLIVAQTNKKLHAFDDIAAQMQSFFLNNKEDKVPAGLGMLVEGYAPRDSAMSGTIIAVGPVTRELSHNKMLDSLDSLQLFKLFTNILEINIEKN